MSTVLTGQTITVVAATDCDVPRNVAGIPAGQTLTDAWLTVKSSSKDADPGVVQKHITTAAVAGVGQITDDGHGGGSLPVGTGALLFQLTAADTAGLTPGKAYCYDIKTKTNAGKEYPVETSMPDGVFRVLRAVTTTT